MGKAYRKFWALLAASILVVLLVVVGFIAVVVPGIIFVTWYAYTIPAIMLEDKGAIEGMAASKAFGRDKKWSSFVVFVVVGIIAVVVSFFGGAFTLFGSSLVGQVVGDILFVPISAWVSVIAAYIYITCGPSSVSATTGAPAFGPMPSATQPSMQASASGARFCSACGSPLATGARFCSNCGKPV
jgi:zinc ribbon protein